MPTVTRTFRVFVSSTFEDLKGERDALQADVFPRVRELCESRHSRFQAIDLRWGVRHESALDQRTLEICLTEIERCKKTGVKPNFIVLLGDRYGWRPAPAHVEAVEFETLLAQAPASERNFLVWDERQPADGKGWYCRDENAVPVEYTLRPRVAAVVADEPETQWKAAQDEEAAEWSATEARLLSIFAAAIKRLGWPEEDKRRIKYEASATHQEILEGIKGTPEDRRHVFAFFRNPAAGVVRDPDLEKLQTFLKNQIGEDHICSFDPGDLTTLKALVEKRLMQAIGAEAEAKPRPELDLEIEAHNRFASEHVQHFKGRRREIEGIQKHVRGREMRPLVVRGSSGCGKSALTAKASEEMPGVVLVRRFVGVTPNASEGISLLRSLCEQLSHDYGKKEETPVDFQSLVTAFHQRLGYASPEKPLAIFLDALDQLPADDPVRSFTWLRESLPPHVGIVLSTTQLPSGIERALLDVEPFPEEAAAAVLDAWLKDAHRTLQTPQRDLVLAAFACTGLPLNLKLAFDAARRWPSFASAESCALCGDADAMVDTLLDRLRKKSNHGPVLVDRSLGYLSAARYGLSEDEMIDLLSTDDEVWRDFISRAHLIPPDHRLPVIIWSRLSLDLGPYLSERRIPGGVAMTICHRQVAERATARFLDGDERPKRHASLARYFRKRADPVGDGTFRDGYPRGLREVVYHQTCGRMWAERGEILSNFAFLQARCELDLGSPGIFDLLDDFRLGGEGAQPPPPGLVSALYVAAPLLAAFPRSLYQELANAGVLDGLTRVPSSGGADPWFRLLDAQASSGLRIKAHAPGQLVCRFSPDGRRLWTAAGDHRIRRWDMQTLREIYPPIPIRRPVHRLVCHPTEPWIAAIAGLPGALQVVVFDAGSAAPLFSYPSMAEPAGAAVRVITSGRPNVYSGAGENISLVPAIRQESYAGFEHFGAIAFQKSGHDLIASLGDASLLRISTSDWVVGHETSSCGPVSCMTAGERGLRTFSVDSALACTVLPDGVAVWGDAGGAVWCDVGDSGGGRQTVASLGSPVAGCAAMGRESVVAGLEDGSVIRLAIPGGIATRLAKMEQRITAIDYSPAVDMIAVGLTDGTLELIRGSLAPGQATEKTTRIAISSDGETVLEVRSDHVHILRQRELVLEQSGDHITACRFFGPSQVVTGTESGWVRVWDLDSGSVTAERNFSAIINWIDCSYPTGAVAVISGNGDVDLWIPDGTPPRRLLQRTRRVAFSPNGRWLAFALRSDSFGALDGEAAWQVQAQYFPHRIDFLQVAADDRWLVAGTNHGCLARMALGAEEPVEELSRAPDGVVGAMVIRDTIVLVGETCQIRCGDVIAGALQIPGLRFFDAAPDAKTFVVKQTGGATTRYRMEGL
jgi:hypothetical protein